MVVSNPEMDEPFVVGLLMEDLEVVAATVAIAVGLERG